MASNARNELAIRLQDVDELISAHTAVTGGGSGRPIQRQGGAITRAGVVLLSAATEAFIEDLFEEAAQEVFSGMNDDQIESFFKNTSRRLNNPDVFKIEMLFFNIGMAWCMGSVKWQKFSNTTFCKELNSLVHTRGTIAHGRSDSVQLRQLKKWRNMVQIFSYVFE